MSNQSRTNDAERSHNLDIVIVILGILAIISAALIAWPAMAYIAWINLLT